MPPAPNPKTNGSTPMAPNPLAGRNPSWHRSEDAQPFADDHIRLDDGRRLAYAEFGDPSPKGRAIFWFPGTPGARTQIPPSAPRIGRAKGLRLIGVDRPGFGGSSPHRRRTLLTWADDIRQLADRLSIERFACVGLSGGGPYVLACAHAMPERMVCGVSLGGVGPLSRREQRAGAPGLPLPLYAVVRGVGRFRGPIAACLGFAIRFAVPFAGQAYDLYVNYGPTSGDQEVMRRPELKNMFLEDALMGIRRGLKGPVWDVSLFARPWPFSPREIRVPIRFWHGDKDPVVPLSHSEHLSQVIPDAHLTVVAGLGHFAGFASAPAVLDQIDALWPEG